MSRHSQEDQSGMDENEKEHPPHDSSQDTLSAQQSHYSEDSRGANDGGEKGSSSGPPSDVAIFHPSLKTVRKDFAIAWARTGKMPLFPSGAYED